MEDVLIHFNREGLDGIVAVGTYLTDAAKRFGVNFEGDCIQQTGEHFCCVQVTGGIDILSPLTKIEDEHFAKQKRKVNERLACQARIDRMGEISIMTEEKKKDAKVEGEQHDEYKKEFTDLPLEKKISALMELEAIALSETLGFIINSPYLVIDKVMDVMAEFGLKQEEVSKKATRPADHNETEKAANAANAAAKPKRKPAARKTATKVKPAE